MTGVRACLLVFLLGLSVSAFPCLAAVETPFLAEKVASGALPPVDQRLPAEPHVVTFDDDSGQAGQPGGDMTMLMARAKDVRILFAYCYARLVAYNTDLNLEPDILKSVDVEDNKVFTLHLRPGHRWSDGSPFTAEDFRYWWEDVILNTDLPPFSPPPEMLSGGEPPKFEVLDETTGPGGGPPAGDLRPLSVLEKVSREIRRPGRTEGAGEGGRAEELGASA
jgi:peptide/nickel transport system substrate-binding protein